MPVGSKGFVFYLAVREQTTDGNNLFMSLSAHLNTETRHITNKMRVRTNGRGVYGFASGCS